MALFGISISMWLVGVIGLSLYIVLYVISITIYGKKPGRNPFVLPSLLVKKPERTADDVINNQSARDSVLRQNFTGSRIPERLDAIVIGSGIGGLTAATLLARARKRVLVLEQHDVIGGCCHTFVDKGYEFDVGIHYIGEMRPGSFVRCLADQLTDGKLMWQPLDVDFDRVIVGCVDGGGKNRSVLVTGDRKEFAKRLAQEWPDDAAGIEAFFSLLDRLKRGSKLYWGLKLLPLPLARLLIKSGLCGLFSAYFRYLHISLKQYLDQHISSESLKSTLAYCFGDYGTPPGETSVVLHALLLNHFLRQGGFYPIGGPSEISFCSVPVIEKAGGRALVRAPVSSIVCNETTGRAVGVTVQRSDGEYTVLAPLIISDAGLINTAKLLPQTALEKSRIPRTLTDCQLRSGHGAMSVFIGLRLPPGRCASTDPAFDDIRGRNLWLLSPSDSSAAETVDLQSIVNAYLSLDPQEAAAADPPLLFASFPSLKDPSWPRRRGDDRLTCAIVTFANWDWFSQWQEGRSGHRGRDYNELKNAIGRRMWELVKCQVPAVADLEVELFQVGTPLTNQHYINSPRGEIYGLDHSLSRLAPDSCAQLRPEMGPPGLLLTGQDVAICGFVGGMMGGLLCASAALNRNLIADLAKLIQADAKGILRRERPKAE
ncbi:hypothetical protein BOX15_Mlig000903g3 [Macrostomum lignano]|uniref:Uncharacterized protein n=2 Tax=Macrostomum lignano TaxID=282301 RepID=A0A267F3D3_9PLAT|nr:hypothetical protein BOX15_Mlig000903g3 [Macrostomum lignano]